MKTFESKVALVTGAAMGIGLVTAKLFAEAGAAVVLADKDEQAVTAAMSGVASQLQAHIGMAMNTGITELQLKQAFTIIEKAVGQKEAAVANKTLEKALLAKQ